MSEQIKKVFYCILIFFIGFFIEASFFNRAEFNYFIYGDNPILHKQKFWTLIFFVLLLLVVSYVLYSLYLRLNKRSKKLVIPLVLLISFLIQYGIIIAIPALPTADSEKILLIASDMVNHSDYSSFEKGGYLFKFPYNFSLALYFRALLALFAGNYFVIKIFNILFTLATTWITYLIYLELSGKQKKNEYGVLIFAATYIPALFMCNYIYNDIIATTLFTGALYFLIRFMKEKRVTQLIIASVLLSMGNYLRNIGAIFLIAAILYLLMNRKEVGMKKLGMACLILPLLFIIPGRAQDIALQATHKVKESIYENSAPVHLWLNMGINMERFGFYDHKESYKIYAKRSKCNKEQSKELFKEEIRRKLKEATVDDMVDMYYRKIVWTWTEGTFQIDRYGFGVEPASVKYKKGLIMGGYSYQTRITELFNRDNQYRGILLWITYVMNFLIYCFILIRLLYCMRNRRFEELLLITVLLGFIGFYILWEIKSRYIYPVYPILIILSYQGYTNAYHFIRKRND